MSAGTVDNYRRMAEVSNGATALQTSAHIPIAQLTPLLAAPASRSIKAVVTLTWPYSSAKGSVAFALSEPDFRLRRTRGQVIVRFSGSSAKVVAKSGIASGDQVTLSLDGAEYGENTEVMPGRGVEFELKFTERLLLQVCSRNPRKVVIANSGKVPTRRLREGANHQYRSPRS